MDQIDILANYIMAEVPGEPRWSEGAGDCAVRLLKQYKVLLDAVNAYRLAQGTTPHLLDFTGDISRTYSAMLVAADQFDLSVVK